MNITKIVYVSTDDYVGFVFNDDDVKMQIDLSEEDSKAIETNVKIGNYMCNVSTDGIYYDVIFINNFKVYYLHYTDYETLIKIIENLK